MNFNEHSNLAGKHAFLSASKYHWINYDNQKLIATYLASKAAQRGTELHKFAAEAIRLGIKLQGTATLAKYVNDALGYRMTPELILYVSDNCYGTADALSFRKGKLRVHDLKTGVTPASVKQLEIYCAMFCMEYRMKPFEIEMEVRIYQNDDIEVHEPDPDEITHIMDQINTFDKLISITQSEGLT